MPLRHKEQLCISREDRSAILDNVQRQSQKQERKKDRAVELAPLKKRLRELESIIEKLYEDNAAGRLTDARMNKLLPKYEQESEMLENRVAAIEAAKDAPVQSQQASREKLDKMLRQITDISKLTPGLLFKLIDHIEIGQGRYEKGEHGKVKRQAVRIYYRFQTEAAVKEYAI